MKIIHFSTSDTGGGAARAAYRVHTGLKLLGHDSTMRVLKMNTWDKEITKFVPSTKLIDRFRVRQRNRRLRADAAPYIKTKPEHGEQFSDDRTPWAGQPLRDLPECDIFNLHWVAGFVDHQAFFDYFAKERPNVPIVWRMADMAPVTGGCHYDRGCDKFTNKCGACPILGSTTEDDLSRQQWHRRDKALAQISDSRLHLVGTSRWIAEQARRSSLLGRFQSTIIPNALDTDIFRPLDKAAARELFNIPQNSKVVLFAADAAKHPRKGFAQLAAAIEGMEGVDNLVLANVGGSRPKIGNGKVLVDLGRIDDDRLLALAYSAADLFVIPSLQESFGQTVIESMACGTPIVGFAAGGITDTVRPGITGELVPVGNVEVLRKTIADLLNNEPLRVKMAADCRRIALAEYALGVQAKQYEALYLSLLAK